MRVDASDYLRLCEQAGTLATWDIESTGFRGDYNSILVISVKPYNEEPVSFSVSQAGNDKKVVREAKAYLETFDCWVTQYGKGFDVKMLDTRLFKWGYNPLVKKPHVDLYYINKAHLNPSRRGLGHMLRWVGNKDAPQKMDVGPDAWSEIIYDHAKHMPKMIERCESDCVGTEELYKKMRHLIQDIKR